MHRAVTVVVDVVAGKLGRGRVNSGIVVVAVQAYGVSVAVGVRLVLGQRVAVIVDTVTGGLGLARIHQRGGVVAVVVPCTYHQVWPALVVTVAVVVHLVRMQDAVAIVVDIVAGHLYRAGIHGGVALVVPLAGVPPVAILVHLVRVQVPIAVIVDVIAGHLHNARVDVDVTIVAVVASAGHVHEPIAVHIWAADRVLVAGCSQVTVSVRILRRAPAGWIVVERRVIDGRVQGHGLARQVRPVRIPELDAIEFLAVEADDDLVVGVGQGEGGPVFVVQVHAAVED